MKKIKEGFNRIYIEDMDLLKKDVENKKDNYFDEEFFIAVFFFILPLFGAAFIFILKYLSDKVIDVSVFLKSTSISCILIILYGFYRMLFKSRSRIIIDKKVESHEEMDNRISNKLRDMDYKLVTKKGEKYFNSKVKIFVDPEYGSESSVSFESNIKYVINRNTVVIDIWTGSNHISSRLLYRGKRRVLYSDLKKIIDCINEE